MNTETANTLIAAGAGLLGAIIGGVASGWATSIQQRREQKAELAREARADERQQRDLTAARAREAAVHIDEAIDKLADWARRRDSAAGTGALREPLGQDYRTGRSEAAFLPIPLRQRVDEALLVLRRPEDLREWHYDDEAAAWAANVIPNELHDVIATWLRGERLPRRTLQWCDFVVAAERAEEHYEEMYMDHIGIDREHAQESWREDNAEELHAIRERSGTASSQQA